MFSQLARPVFFFPLPLSVFQFCLFSILIFFNSIFSDPTSSWFCSIPLFCVFRSWGVWGRRMRTVAASQCLLGHSGWDSSSCVGWKTDEELGDHGCSSHSFLWVSWWRMYWLGSGSLNVSKKDLWLAGMPGHQFDLHLTFLYMSVFLKKNFTLTGLIVKDKLQICHSVRWWWNHNSESNAKNHDLKMS